MERLLFTFRLAPGTEAEYERAHAEIWPELVADLRAAGWSNYTLFRRGLQVFAYAECEPTAAEAIARIEASEVNARWSAMIRALMTECVDADGRLLTADELWHLA